MVSSSGVVLIRCSGRGRSRSGLRTVAAVPRETSAAAARAETVGRAPWRAACRRAAARARFWAEVGGGAAAARGAGVGRAGRSAGFNAAGDSEWTAGRLDGGWTVTVVDSGGLARRYSR